MKHLLTSIKSSLASGVSKPSRSNRKAIAELRALSDNQLKDIGIDRSSITHSVLHGKPDRNAPKKAA